MAEKHRNRWLSWGFVTAVIVIVLGVWYFRRGHQDAPQYQTVSVKRGNIIQLVTATGTLNPVTNVTVGCQVSGKISKLFADYNSVVTNGQLLARIDPRTYEAQVAQVSAQLQSAKANLELQDITVARDAQLYTNKLLSASDYDTAVATRDEAKATVAISEASLNNAKANLGFCNIYSPIDGVVLSRNVDVGQTVAANFSAPTLFEIANNLRQMQIDAAIDEADIGNVKKGQAVTFTVDAYPSRTFHGVVNQVRNAPTTSNNVVTYDTIIGVTNTDYSLKPGMTATVSIIAADRTNVLEIPNAALRFQPPASALAGTNAPGAQKAMAFRGGRRGGFRRGDRAQIVHVDHHSTLQTVYLLRSNAAGGNAKLEAVKIKTGITDNINTVVLSGLQEGEQVVTGLQIPGLNSNQGARNPFTRRRRF